MRALRFSDAKHVGAFNTAWRRWREADLIPALPRACYPDFVATAPTNATTGLRLSPFESRFAEVVAEWAADPQDAFLVAPHTPPPITAQRVLEWSGAARHPCLLMDHQAPRAYGELNLLNPGTRRWWLGHLLVDPQQRGRGLGRRLVEQLLRKAFREEAARCVTLVVYPDNHRAIRSYRSAGLREDGYERHDFTPYRMQVQMLRMAVYARHMKPAKLSG